MKRFAEKPRNAFDEEVAEKPRTPPMKKLQKNHERLQ
jgi:hypothetical protein